MAQGKFSAQVSAWVRETKERQLAVRNEAVQRVLEVAQTPVARGGNMPVDSGFLRASLMAAIGNANFSLTDKPDGEGSYSFDMGQVALIIASASITDTITAAYTANYARHQEYGARGRAGRRFVGLAAQQWPRIVEEVAKEAQARAGG
jgi:hypothetical protein